MKILAIICLNVKNVTWNITFKINWCLMKTQFDTVEFISSITRFQWGAIISLILLKFFGLIGFFITLLSISNRNFKPFAVALVILAFTCLISTFFFCAKSVLNGEMENEKS